MSRRVNRRLVDDTSVPKSERRRRKGGHDADGARTTQSPSRPSLKIVSCAEHDENSDVLPAGSVAVAVITCRSAGTVKSRGPNATSFGLVMTSEKPMKILPSPCPAASQPAFAKNSRRNAVLAVLFSEPETCAIVLGPI